MIISKCNTCNTFFETFPVSEIYFQMNNNIILIESLFILSVTSVTLL